MPEGTQEGATATSNQSTAQDGGDATQQGAQAGAGGGAQEGAPVSLEDALAANERARSDLEATRREAAGYRTRLRELEQAEETRRRETLPKEQALTEENTALKDRIAELEAREGSRLFDDAASNAAKTLGFRNPSLAAGLIPAAERAKLVDDGGKPDNEGLTARLRDILKSDPYLGTAGGSDAGAGRGQQSGATMNDRIRGAAGVPT